MGLWTCFGFMAASGVLVAFLWWRLGSSSEYGDLNPGLRGGEGEGEGEDGEVGQVVSKTGSEEKEKIAV